MRKIFPLCLLELLLCFEIVHAADINWQGGYVVDDLKDSMNWSPTTVPGAGDVAHFGSLGLAHLVPKLPLLQTMSTTFVFDADATSQYSVTVLGTFTSAGDVSNASAFSQGIDIHDPGSKFILQGAHSAGVGSPVIYNVTLGGLLWFTDTSTAGTATIFLDSAGQLTFNHPISVISLFSNDTSDSISMVSNATLTIGSGGLDSTIAGSISGTASNSLIKQGVGTLTLLGANTYGGGTTFSQGTISIGSNNALGASSGQLAMANGTILDIQNAVSASNPVNLNGTNTITVFSGTGTLAGGISGGGNLIKTGSGTLVLSGNNSYTGGTSLSQGTLSISGSAALGTSSSLQMADMTTLDLQGSASSIVPIVFTGMDTVNVSSGTGTLSGGISGGGDLTKTGSGTLVLSGNNSYTGGTHLSQGTLSISGSAALGASSSLQMADMTILDLQSNASSAVPIVLTGVDTVNVSSGTGTLSGVVSGGGSLTKTGSGTLVLSGNNSYTGSTSLSQGTLSISGSAALGASSSLQMADMTILDLQSNASSAVPIVFTGVDTVNVSSGTGTLSGVVSGGGSLTKTGSGTLVLSGNNSYTGSTSLSQGTLSISGSAALGASSSFQMADMTILDLQSNASSIAPIVFTGVDTINVSSGHAILSGVMDGMGVTLDKTGNGTLVLSGTNTYTGMTNLNTGIISISGSSALGEMATPLNMAHLTTLTLQNSASSANPITIGGLNTLNVEMGDTGTLSGMISGGGVVNKMGIGTLIVSGANSYTGLTNLKAGTLSISGSSALGSFLTPLAMFSLTTLDLQNGGIVPNPIILLGINTMNVSTGIGTLSASGALSGMGILTKTGSGTLILESGRVDAVGGTIVSEGTLRINSLFESSSVNVSATLEGTGTIVGNVVIETNGILAPGNSIGTMYVVGNYVQGPYSFYNCEISPSASDLLVVSGAVSIDPTAAFVLLPEVGEYSSNLVYPVIQSGGLTGTFSNLSGSIAGLNYQLFYDPQNVFLLLNSVPLASLTECGNAKAVAKVLDEFIASGGTSSADMATILIHLLSLDDPALTQALDQMQPSLYTGTTIVQQNNVIKVRDALKYYLQTLLDRTHCTTHHKKTEWERTNCVVWVDAFGDLLHQERKSTAHCPSVGYHNTTWGIVAGSDVLLGNDCYLGALGGYTHADVDWTDDRAGASINSGYAGVYCSALGPLFYGTLSLIGSGSGYDVHRRITYPDVDRKASGDFDGVQLLSHIDTGINWGGKWCTIRPFESFDYIVQREGAFTESGADALNLSVKKNVATMLRNELGLNIAGCFPAKDSHWIVDLKVGWVYEARFKGASYRACFINTRKGLTVKGFYPDRSLFSPGISLTGNFLEGRCLVSGYYEGEFGSQFNDQALGGQFAFKF